MVESFHDQWGQEAALNTNTRDYQRNNDEESNDEEVQKDENQGFSNIINRYNSPVDAKGCTKI
jgi:hypothetical protein